MIAALITGTLCRAPEQRTSRTGKPFVMATVKIRDCDSFQFVRIVALSESVQAELLRLTDGDHAIVQGPLKCETYEISGEHRISLSIVADHVLALRQPPKQRKPEAAQPPDTRSKQERQRGTWTSPVDGPLDEIRF